MYSRLAAPLRGLHKEASWLTAEFFRSATPRSRPAPARQSDLCCEMVIIRLHDAWARFCREVVIRSACGNTITLSGSALVPSPGITERSLVIPTLVATYPKRRFEPRWADASECIDAAQRLRVSNLSTLAAALGAVGSPADSLRKVRNYYVHRGWDAALDATSTGVFAHSKHPFAIDLAAYASGGVRILESWVISLLSIARAAVQ